MVGETIWLDSELRCVTTERPIACATMPAPRGRATADARTARRRLTAAGIVSSGTSATDARPGDPAEG